jgi:hypothetical protein
MNKERFVAANAIALITHTLVLTDKIFNTHAYRLNLSTLSKSDLKCFKKERPLQELLCREVGIPSTFGKRPIMQEVVSENSGHRKPYLNNHSIIEWMHL